MSIEEICRATKQASQEFASASQFTKDAILREIISVMRSNQEYVLSQNDKDMLVAKEAGKSDAFLDRLKIKPATFSSMLDGISAIINLTDPVGEIVSQYSHKNGIIVKKIRSPLGVIGVIFEARPNVVVDAVALCIKSGNGVVLRGSREAYHSVSALVSVIKKALQACGIMPELCGNVTSMDRSDALVMLRQNKYIDLIIPRGGNALKKLVLENATMPMLAAAGGNCHMYIAASANEDMAIKLAVDAKLNRPGVCNALETLLIDRSKSAEFIKRILSELSTRGAEIRGSDEVATIYPVKVVDESEFYIEYEAPIIKVALVDGVASATAHIVKFGTGHSESIVTEDYNEFKYFLGHTDSAAVYHNVSTRFTDGFEFGLGAEIGISTQKLHARGPIGLRELTCEKYMIEGNGQTRGNV
ncbi:MAG: glutamate-5-semialdehyde dehydrogenase [Christensenellaceae bacterium]|jgi:glutamate-5-semialdehyde dehydrogenase|nr:glutamate-5-semialdehyde dehydrogenase [Christensenellaceae bacterium]